MEQLVQHLVEYLVAEAAISQVVFGSNGWSSIGGSRLKAHVIGWWGMFSSVCRL